MCTAELERALVAQAAAGVLAPIHPLRLPVALVRCEQVPDLLTFVVKVTLDTSGEPDARGIVTAHLGEQEPVTVDRPSELVGASDSELARASDFVVAKAGVDVGIVGHAHGTGESSRIDARVTIDGWSLGFAAQAPSPRDSIALVEPLLAPVAGEVDPEPVAPRPAAAIDSERDLVTLISQVSARQRLPQLSPGCSIELVNLSPRGEKRKIELPRLVPRVVVDLFSNMLAIEMNADTLWIDTDFDRIVMVWRGHYLSHRGGREIHRLVVGLDGEQERSETELLRDLARGEFFFAVEEDDARSGVSEVDGVSERLEVARLETLEHAAAPLLPLERYAQIGAELAEGREERKAVLSRYGYDETAWVTEERAWLEHMAERLQEGDTTTAEQYGDAFVAAQQRLAAAHEPRPLAAFAELLVAMEGDMSPLDVLGEWNITMGEWCRLERHWRGTAAQDPEVARELDSHILRHRRGSA